MCLGFFDFEHIVRNHLQMQVRMIIISAINQKGPT
jgi:hypothetical protein